MLPRLRSHLTLVAVALVLGLAGGVASADPRPPRPPRPPKALDGAVAEKQVETLAKSVRWHESLEDALRDARAKSRLVLWVHALGDLAGDT